MIISQQVLKPSPLNPTPATWRKRKRKLHCNFWNAALQKCTATLAFLQCRCHFCQKVRCSKRKLQCNIEKAALQKSGAFLPLFCRFQAPTFRHPRLGPAELGKQRTNRDSGVTKSEGSMEAANCNLQVPTGMAKGWTTGGTNDPTPCAPLTFTNLS